MTSSVVLDNNAYTALSDDRLTRLMAAEAAAGITAYASPVVTQELLATVRHGDPKRRTRARSGLRRLVRHTSTTTPEGRSVRFLSSTDAQIHFALIGREHERDHRLANDLGALAANIAAEPWEGTLDEYHESLTAIEHHVTTTEAQYVIDLEEKANNFPSDTDEITLRLNHASSLMRRSSAHYGVTFEGDAIERRTFSQSHRLVLHELGSLLKK